MDENVLTEVLNATLARTGEMARRYEVEIANITAEVIRLRAQVAELTEAAEDKKAVKATVK